MLGLQVEASGFRVACRQSQCTVSELRVSEIGMRKGGTLRLGQSRDGPVALKGKIKALHPACRLGIFSLRLVSIKASSLSVPFPRPACS